MRKVVQIPDEVIEVFNDLIAKHFNGVYATFMQEEAVKLILKKFARKPEMAMVTRDKIFDDKWLDVEDIYRQAGWDVEYDKPAFNESYPASFTFAKRKK